MGSDMSFSHLSEMRRGRPEAIWAHRHMPPKYKFGRVEVCLSLGTNYFTAKKGFQCAIRCLWFGFLGTGARAAKGRGKTGQELWDVPGVWTECQCLPSVDPGNQVLCYLESYGPYATHSISHKDKVHKGAEWEGLLQHLCCPKLPRAFYW